MGEHLVDRSQDWLPRARVFRWLRRCGGPESCYGPGALGLRQAVSEDAVFCDCAVLRDDGSIEHRVAREAADDSFPFTAKILSRASRLSCTMEASPGIHGVSISTSDELALFLLSHKPHWQLVPLLHDIDVEGPDLLHMDIRGRSEVVEAPAASQRRTTMWKLPEEFDLGDPLEHGRKSAEPADVGRGDAAGAARVEALAESFVDIENLIAVPPDVVGDVFMELYGLADCALVAESGQEDDACCVGVSDSEDLADDAVANALVEYEEEAPIEGEAVAAAGAEELIEVVAIASPEQCANVSVIDPDGYVSCALPPFGERGVIGRLTYFPKGVALEKTNIGMRCYLHANCSVTRRAHKLSAERMKLWLFNGLPGWGDESVDHKKAHGIRATALL